MPRTEVVLYREDGRTPVLEWLNRLPYKAQIKCLSYLGLLGQLGHELRRPIAEYLRDGIYELRTSYQGVHYRILYFFPKAGRDRGAVLAQVVVVSHGLIKEREVPAVEIERAIERKRKFDADPETHTSSLEWKGGK